jgi:hypothetical protein
VSIAEKTPRTDDSGADRSSGARGRRARRKPIAIGAALLLLAGGSVAVALRDNPWSQGSDAAPTAPITLPSHLAGLSPMLGAADQYASAAWQAKAQAATGGAPVAGHIYGTRGAARSVRAAAARGDLTGKLDLAWAADEGHEVGKARCTQNVQLVPGGRVAVRPTVMVCWRKAEGLSAYVAIIDPKTTLTDADGGKAIDELWTAVTAAK